MGELKYDCIVLGAGMVGVSAALQLQKRGFDVALVDRRPAAEETSYGNAGIIQTEAVMPYPFPRDLGKILSVARDRSTDARMHWRALPEIAPWLYQYWRNGTKERVLKTARAAFPLVRACLDEHKNLMKEAGAEHLARSSGYLQVHRRDEDIQQAEAAHGEARDLFGVEFATLDQSALRELEPHLSEELAGGIHFTGPVCISDPSALGKAYADLFKTRGGTFKDGGRTNPGGGRWRLAGPERRGADQGRQCPHRAWPLVGPATEGARRIRSACGETRLSHALRCQG